MAAASAAPPRRKVRRSSSPFPAAASSFSHSRFDRLLGFFSMVVFLASPRLSAATPQLKQKQTFHHEGHEEHEVQKYKIYESFVAFVCFVVRSYFLVDSAT